jgi:hypothetical protein
MEHKGMPLRADRHRSAKSRLGASSPSISSAYPLRTRLDERESEIESLREESSLAIGEIQRLHDIAARAQKLGLVTSAFDMLYTDFISHFDEPLLSHASAAGVALGHVDHRDEPMRLFGRESDHWIRTSFFFLPQPAVRALHSIVSCEPGPNIFSSDPSRPFLDEAPLADELKDIVTSWLTGEGTGQGVTWHSRFDLDHDTFEYFKQKATTIFNEALLTVRLHEFGFPVIDVSWLSVELAQASAAQVDWNLPWREQLAPRLAALPDPATPRASETI